MKQVPQDEEAKRIAQANKAFSEQVNRELHDSQGIVIVSQPTEAELKSRQMSTFLRSLTNNSSSARTTQAFIDQHNARVAQNKGSE
jgi:hypothetical protein